MRSFATGPGSIVDIKGSPHVVAFELDFDYIVARDLQTGVTARHLRKDVTPHRDDSAPTTSLDLGEVKRSNMGIAEQRLRAIKPFLEQPHRPRHDVERAASEIGVDATTLYRWMRQYRKHGRLSALLPKERTGGKGKSRLNSKVDEVINQGIEHFYLHRQRPTVKATAEHITRLCRSAGLKPPALNTIRARIFAIDAKTVLKQRGHSKVVKDRFIPHPGKYQEADRPLAIAAIDHTQLSNMIVDHETRMSIGRPYLTLVIDLYSRMILGFCLSLEAPSTLTVGLALTHAILPKESWLERHGLPLDAWPCWGFPAQIHVDNGSEFHSEALRVACNEYGIEIDHTPVKNPTFNGHVERMLGTIQTASARVPGRAFPPGLGGDYDSEKAAVMTLDELEGWLTEWITGVYHQRVHQGMNESPIARWTTAALSEALPGRLASGIPERPSDEERLRIDFLPTEKRTIQPYGIMLFHIQYFADVLKPYIAPRNQRKHQKFTFRYDPRDVSEIYFWNPELRRHFPIPYRNVAHPHMSLWELREITRQLKQQGREEIDEDLIFRTYLNLERREHQAASTTKKARRNRERKRLTPIKPTKTASATVIVPWDPAEIEAFEVGDV